MSNPFRKAARSALKRANLALHRVGYKIVATSAGETSAGERSRLESWPRYRRTTTNLIGATITIIDSASFLWQYEDIFERDLLKFTTKKFSPVILDCGANIGLATLYWKRLYPEAQIIAFEPDPAVYSVLSHNVSYLRGVEAVQRAVWITDGEMPFWREGADSGSLTGTADKPLESIESVRTVRLRDYLDRTIDMLKMDIEGAEVDVISDCADQLHNVKNLSVEYHSFSGQKQRVDEIFKVLIESGFRLHVLHEYPAMPPLIAPKERQGMDLQLVIFGYRD